GNPSPRTIIPRRADLLRGHTDEHPGSHRPVPLPLPVREKPQPEDPEGLLHRPPAVVRAPGRRPRHHRPPRRRQDRPPHLHQEPLQRPRREERQEEGGDPEGPLQLPGERGPDRPQPLPQDGSPHQGDETPAAHRGLRRPQAPLQAPLPPQREARRPAPGPLQDPPPRHRRPRSPLRHRSESLRSLQPRPPRRRPAGQTAPHPRKRSPREASRLRQGDAARPHHLPLCLGRRPRHSRLLLPQPPRPPPLRAIRPHHAPQTRQSRRPPPRHHATYAASFPGDTSAGGGGGYPVHPEPAGTYFDYDDSDLYGSAPRTPGEVDCGEAPAAAVWGGGGVRESLEFHGANLPEMASCCNGIPVIRRPVCPRILCDRDDSRAFRVPFPAPALLRAHRDVPAGAGDAGGAEALFLAFGRHLLPDLGADRNLRARQPLLGLFAEQDLRNLHRNGAARGVHHLRADPSVDRHGVVGPEEASVTWPGFSFAYAVVALASLVLCKGRLKGRWQPAVRTVIGVTMMLCIFDGVAESRLLWRFPALLGIYALDVPLENIVITFATVVNSLVLFLLFDERPSS